DVLHQHGNASRLGIEHDVLDVAHRADQAETADVHRLLADVDGAAAHVDVGVTQRGENLRQGDAVGVELVEVDLDVVRLRRAAPGHHLNDAGHGEQAALHDPILKGT